jgi:hypothetical protein
MYLIFLKKSVPFSTKSINLLNYYALLVLEVIPHFKKSPITFNETILVIF